MSPSNSIVSEKGYRQAYNRAIKFLSMRSRSTFEVSADLRGKGFTGKIIGQVIDELTEKGWLNDRELAQRIIVNTQRASKGWAKIYNILRSRGFDRYNAEEALNAFYDLQQETECINALVGERLSSFSRVPSAREAEKIIMSISNRGFPPMRIRRSLESLINDIFE